MKFQEISEAKVIETDTHSHITIHYLLFEKNSAATSFLVLP